MRCDKDFASKFIQNYVSPFKQVLAEKQDHNVKLDWIQCMLKTSTLSTFYFS